jgi:hypothetical protein
LCQLVCGQQGIGLKLANSFCARRHIERLDLEDTVEIEGIGDVNLGLCRQPKLLAATVTPGYR